MSTFGTTSLDELLRSLVREEVAAAVERLRAQQGPELLSVAEAARRLSIGRTELYRLISAGQLRTVKIGSRRLVPDRALADLIEQLEGGPR